MTQRSPEEQDHIDHAYLDFLVWQCDNFKVALFRVQSAAMRLDWFRNTSDIAGLFMDIQSATGFAANVAKMLWPNPSRRIAHIAKPRGERLRNLVGIDRDPVLEDLDLRNDFEHLDERVDKWTQRPHLNIALHTVGPDSMISGLPLEDRFTRFDPSTGTASILLHSVKLQDLHESVSAVRDGALRAIQVIDSRRGPHPFPQGPTQPHQPHPD